MIVKNQPLLRAAKTVIDIAALRVGYCLYKAAQAIITIGHVSGSSNGRPIELCTRCRIPSKDNPGSGETRLSVESRRTRDCP